MICYELAKVAKAAAIAVTLWVPVAAALAERPLVDRNRDWRVVSFGERNNIVSFLDAKSIERARKIAKAEVLMVMNEVAGTPPSDNTQVFFRVDCSTMRNWVSRFYHRMGSSNEGFGYAPPASRDGHKSPPGTTVDAILKMACGHKPIPKDRVADPYRWARAHMN